MHGEHLAWMREYFKKVYKTPILENFLGLKLLELEEGKVAFGFKAAARHCNFYGTVHGGALASVSDVAMGVACVSLGRRVVTIDMNVSYIKNAPAGSALTARGRVISNGKNIMRAEGHVYHGEQLLVRSQASYFVTGEFSKEDHPGKLKKD
ncbi:MAG TPA: PaaI family thioesterase [Elusimicrobia bacterium]|nr:PaaI family thioesterase [Elusimicrobiota bacterium]